MPRPANLHEDPRIAAFDADQLTGMACEAQLDGFVTANQAFPEDDDTLQSLADAANHMLGWYGCEPNATVEHIYGQVVGRQALMATQKHRS